MAKRRGSITIDRNLRDWWGWSNPLYVRSWLDLLMMAAWRDHTRDFQGTPVRVKRGQIVTSQRILAERWSCGRQIVRTFLRNLDKTDAISTRKLTHQYTLITICNYEDYQLQPNDQPTEKPTANPQPTHGQPTANPQKNTANTGKARENTLAPGKPARKRDPLWDAFAEEVGVTDNGSLTDTERAVWNGALKELRKVGATAQQMHGRCAEFRRRWPDLTLTLPGIKKHWAELGATPRGKAKPPQPVVACTQCDWSGPADLLDTHIEVKHQLKRRTS